MHSLVPSHAGNSDTIAALLRLVSDAVLIIDLDGRITGWSQGAERLLGHEPDEALGNFSIELFAPGQRAAYQKHLQSIIATGTATAFETTLQTRSGQPRAAQALLIAASAGATTPGCILCKLVAREEPESRRDVTGTPLRDPSQLDRDNLLRSAYRNMHHRIKNSLHGVIGILRLYEARQIDPAALIDQCVVQLMAAAASFELASKPGKVGIPLPELVCDIAQSVEQVSRRHIGVHVSAAIRQQPITLTQEHSVNLSLAISELFFNAVKHGVDRHGQREVKVVVDRHDDVAILQVINVGGVLPAGFCFEAGTGLGTGLDLLKALIPAKGARLTISQQPEGVVAELRMQTPVVAVE